MTCSDGNQPRRRRSRVIKVMPSTAAWAPMKKSGNTPVRVATPAIGAEHTRGQEQGVAGDFPHVQPEAEKLCVQFLDRMKCE